MEHDGAEVKVEITGQERGKGSLNSPNKGKSQVSQATRGLVNQRTAIAGPFVGLARMEASRAEPTGQATGRRGDSKKN